MILTIRVTMFRQLFNQLKNYFVTGNKNVTNIKKAIKIINSRSNLSIVACHAKVNKMDKSNY